MYKISLCNKQIRLNLEYSKISTCFHKEDAEIIQRLIRYIFNDKTHIQQSVEGIKYYIEYFK